jgi:hypothetical protein
MTSNSIVRQRQYAMGVAGRGGPGILVTENIFPCTGLVARVINGKGVLLCHFDTWFSAKDFPRIMDEFIELVGEEAKLEVFLLGGTKMPVYSALTRSKLIEISVEHPNIQSTPIDLGFAEGLKMRSTIQIDVETQEFKRTDSYFFSEHPRKEICLESVLGPMKKAKNSL